MVDLLGGVIVGWRGFHHAAVMKFTPCLLKRMNQTVLYGMYGALPASVL